MDVLTRVSKMCSLLIPQPRSDAPRPQGEERAVRLWQNTKMRRLQPEGQPHSYAPRPGCRRLMLVF